MNASCVLVTRGDVDLEPVLETLRPVFDDILVWGNDSAVGPALVRVPGKSGTDWLRDGDVILRAVDDQKVFGRYAAILAARYDLIYTQDDDALCPAAEILETYMHEHLLVNVEPEEKPWLAWGAVFPRDAPFKAFARYLARYPADDFFRRWPDVVFAELTPWASVDLGHENLPWAYADTRMYRQPDHYTSQDEMRDRCRGLA